MAFATKAKNYFLGAAAGSGGDAAGGSSGNNLKAIRRILPSPGRHWVGDAFHVFPVFHDLAFSNELSPWLMFDYAAPKKFEASPSHRRGVGQHPHRGFETITLAFQGEVEHGDSVGNRGVIGAGDVQWMTAARGIIHEEFHSDAFSKEGGMFEMAQLWLNLPASHKMSKPRYQPIVSQDIPVVPLFRVASGAASAAAAAAAACAGPESEAGSSGSNEGGVAAATAAMAGAAVSVADGSVRVIAGRLGQSGSVVLPKKKKSDAKGRDEGDEGKDERGSDGAAEAFVQGAAETVTPVELFDVTLKVASAPFELEFPRGHNVMVFVRRGGVMIEGQKVEAQGVALMHKTGTTLRFEATEPNTQLLVLGGEPLNEPIANRGPFVMNTNAELQTAMVDYRNGKLGK
mmetsp:Transcript_92260/g.183748  ORF Transcript_92260/g.183748 Transcript_92260/m.183748 type:complete len:401 (-) Transcript_92260:164-1366(-)